MPCNRQSIASALLLVRPGESDAGVLDGAGGSAGASRLARIGASGDGGAPHHDHDGWCALDASWWQ